MFGINKPERDFLLKSLCAVGVMVAAAGVGNAQITGELWQNQSTPGGNALLGYGDPTSPLYLGTPDATFDSGAISYNPTDTGAIYTPAAFLNNPTFHNQSAAFNPNASLDNTYFYFTGSLFLNAGMNSFVVGHDDGLQLHIDGIGTVVDRPGPTGLDETPFNVTAPTAGTYHFELSYGECCGPPASLVWEINQQTVGGNVPDAASTLPLLGIGLGGIAALYRRMRK
jgi:hypothetical protein